MSVVENEGILRSLQLQVLAPQHHTIPEGSFLLLIPSLVNGSQGLVLDLVL